MQQSNALRKLEEILTESVNNGNRKDSTGNVLLKAMNRSKPQDIVDFYELLNKAEEETRSAKTKDDIDKYLKVIEGLQEFFIINHIWATLWEHTAVNLESKNVLLILDSLANSFSVRNPTLFLEQDFLEQLNKQFQELLNETLESNLSKQLKTFLIKRIEDILKAIYRYYIDGTEGIEKATKSFVSDLVLLEHKFNSEDKNNCVFKRTKAFVLGMLIYLIPGPYDIIGAVPDIYEFWIPKIEELTAGTKIIEQLINQDLTVQECLEKGSNIFDKQQQKSITGRNQKALSPASDDKSLIV